MKEILIDQSASTKLISWAVKLAKDYDLDLAPDITKKYQDHILSLLGDIHKMKYFSSAIAELQKVDTLLAQLSDVERSVLQPDQFDTILRIAQIYSQDSSEMDEKPVFELLSKLPPNYSSKIGNIETIKVAIFCKGLDLIFPLPLKDSESKLLKNLKSATHPQLMVEIISDFIKVEILNPFGTKKAYLINLLDKIRSYFIVPAELVALTKISPALRENKDSNAPEKNNLPPVPSAPPFPASEQLNLLDMEILSLKHKLHLQEHGYSKRPPVVQPISLEDQIGRLEEEKRRLIENNPGLALIETKNLVNQIVYQGFWHNSKESPKKEPDEKSEHKEKTDFRK